MKKFLALICALILVCSVAATALAACTHTYILVYETVARYYSEPYCWTTCAYNQYTHPHLLNYKDVVYVYYCPKCGDTYTKTVKTFINQSCPCQP
ncbi:MAG: hypothetical protein IKZ98_08820 [Clostridia bacterium]|nr:hypothetical protein [Clostridia bacterium]